MLNFQAMQLMHRHTDGRTVPMIEVGHRSPADQDEERDWLRGARIFRCPECNEEVVVGAPEATLEAPGERA
jgi:hypothetical protein